MYVMFVHALMSHPLTSREESEEQPLNMPDMFVHALMSHPLTSMEESEEQFWNMYTMFVHALMSHPLTSREEREEQSLNMPDMSMHALTSHPLTSREEREMQPKNMPDMSMHALVSHPLTSREESEEQSMNMLFAVKSLSPKGVFTSCSEEQLVKIKSPLNTVFGRVISSNNVHESKPDSTIMLIFLKYTSSLNLAIDSLYVNRLLMFVTASTCS